MADWDVASAVNSLRSLLGDAATDKYEFKTDVFPTPDSVTTRFFVGQTRVVEDSLQVYVAGVETAVSGTPTWETGTFDLAVAPSGSVDCQTSFYYQWFTDDELEGFVTLSAQLLGFSGITDSTLLTGIRTVVLMFACYHAYMKKAAEYADAITASAAGYTYDQAKSHPNWRELAKAAYDAAKKALDLFVENPLNGALRPLMRTVTFRMQRYQPL